MIFHTGLASVYAIVGWTSPHFTTEDKPVKMVSVLNSAGLQTRSINLFAITTTLATQIIYMICILIRI